MDKEVISELLTRPIAFHPIFSRVAGGATAGLFLSQLFYWTGRGADPDGWIYKEAKDFQAETTLTVDEQRTARRKLRNLQVLKEERRGLNPTIFYRLDMERMAELISRELENPNRRIEKSP